MDHELNENLLSEIDLINVWILLYSFLGDQKNRWTLTVNAVTERSESGRLLWTKSGMIPFLEHMVAFHVQLVPWGACSFSVLYFRTCSIFENHVFAHQVINLDHSWSIINRSKYEKFYHMFNHMFYFIFRAYFSNGKILICGNFSDWRRKCENTRISKIM